MGSAFASRRPGGAVRTSFRRRMRRDLTVPSFLRLAVILATVGACVTVGSVPAAGATRATRAARWWKPPLGPQPWQWELSNPLRLGNARDMGTDDVLPDGRPAPAPVIYDIDAIINPASTVAALHAMGKHVVCYVEVGAAGNYYSAADEGVTTTYFDKLQDAGVFGKKVPGYQEYYLNIQSSATVSIIESMIDEQCATKGFDAVETDIDEEYTDNSGFPLTKAIEQKYMTTIAHYIHSLKMGWWIKNPDDTGDSYATDMYPLADAVLTEQCNQYSSCGLLSAYVGHKPVFNAEYRLKTSEFCPADDALGFNGVRFALALAGRRWPCQ